MSLEIMYFAHKIKSWNDPLKSLTFVTSPFFMLFFHIPTLQFRSGCLYIKLNKWMLSIHVNWSMINVIYIEDDSEKSKKRLFSYRLLLLNNKRKINFCDTIKWRCLIQLKGQVSLIRHISLEKDIFYFTDYLIKKKRQHLNLKVLSLSRYFALYLILLLHLWLIVCLLFWECLELHPIIKHWLM